MGTISKVSNGFGFIVPDDRSEYRGDMFYHVSGFDKPTSIRSLSVGDRVAYNVSEDRRRRNSFMATNIIETRVEVGGTLTRSIC
jgi:cold shock CspA family protein